MKHLQSDPIAAVAQLADDGGAKRQHEVLHNSDVADTQARCYRDTAVTQPWHSRDTAVTQP